MPQQGQDQTNEQKAEEQQAEHGQLLFLCPYLNSDPSLQMWQFPENLDYQSIALP
jgi:hypothetical protein